MAQNLEAHSEPLDTAAVFACALSLREACLMKAAADAQLKLSECFNGMDEFLRVVMRVANCFEDWACDHVVFEAMSEVWPYHMEEKFGEACLEVIELRGLANFDEKDCLRVALRMRLPIRWDAALRIPVDISAPNPIAGSDFTAFRIQTVRDDFDESGVVPFTSDDDPFDGEFGAPYFALYGVGGCGLMEHIADRRTYAEILSLVQKLSPGVSFPLSPVGSKA